MLTARPVLVGRDAELGELREVLAGIGVSGARLVLLTGPAGRGKSALAEQLAAEQLSAEQLSAEPVRVLRARAVPWEQEYAGGVLRQLLQTDVPDDPVAAAEQLREAVTGPTLAVVDDAGAGDACSLQTLSTVVRHHRSLPLLVLLVARSADGVLASLGGEELRLGPVAPADVAELAAARGRALHPAMAEALWRHTQGNPGDAAALLEELPASRWARYDPDLPAPAHVAADVGGRLAGCGGAARALVAAVAVLAEPTEPGEHGAGPPVALAEAAALADLSDPLPALDEAVRAELLTPDLQQPAPMVRSAVLAHLGEQVSADLHRRAADVVADPARRLGHLVAAAPTVDDALADDVDRLARQRADAGAWGVAAGLWRQAGRLTSDPLLRDERLTRSVDAQVAAGDALGASALVPVIESLRETPLRDAVLAYLAVLRGRAAEAGSRLRRAWDIVNVDRDPATAGLIAQRHVLHALARCQGPELVRWADRAIALAGADSPAGLEAAAIRGLGVAAAGDPDAALASYAELAERVPHGAQAQRVAMGMGWLELAVDRVEDARVRLESALSTELGGSTRIALWSAAWLARAHVVTGDWDQALRVVERGRELARTSGMTLIIPLLEWTAAQVSALRGEWQQAEESVRVAESLALGYEVMQVPCQLARAQVAEARSDYAGVLQALEPLTRVPAGTSLDEPGFWPWVDVLANALVVEGRYDAADALLTGHEARARERGHRSSLVRLGYARGRLQGATGDLAAARASFEESLRLLEAMPLRYDLARVRFAFGQTLRRAGKRREADRMLSLARDVYLALGARTYVERCDRELKAGGVHAVRGDRGPDDLTPQEESVADLVATGLSNREVAARLFVSPKTVQYHLTRIYAKLGVRTRAELAAMHPTLPGPRRGA
ncbi:helix-turn-helix transcriptional regulator [Nocardioides cheoyonin]|uniref:helix-turn-helix transcriptional regulator n=1 Tax=Nocardioides cheoyonin TaxID=3156615 RepID=UPI0032B5B569